jgi:hypothetical protein
MPDDLRQLEKRITAQFDRMDLIAVIVALVLTGR